MQINWNCLYCIVNLKRTTMKQQILFARMREVHSPGFFTFILQPGDTLPVDKSKSLFSKDDEIYLMKTDIFGIAHFPVPKRMCTFVFKVVEPMFNMGDIVIKKGTDIPFRIHGIRWDRVGFFYTDGWGMSQGAVSGSMENELRMATEDEIIRNQAYIEYYEELMRRSNTVITGLTFESRA